MKRTIVEYTCDICGKSSKRRLKFSAKTKLYCFHEWTKIDLCEYCFHELIDKCTKHRKELEDLESTK